VVEKFADLFMRTRRGNDDYFRMFFAVLRKELAPSVLENVLKEACKRALNDDVFMGSFIAQFEDAARAEEQRGARGGSREPREGAATPEMFARDELEKRAKWATSRAKRSRATEDERSLLAGLALDEQWNNPRVSIESFDHGIQFIVGICKLGWRAGKLHTAKVASGVTMENIPFLVRDGSIDRIWAAYKEACEKVDGKFRYNGHPALGRETMRVLIKSLTREVEESACLSYYFTDMIEALRLLKEMLGRVEMVWNQYSVGLDEQEKGEYSGLGYTLTDLARLLDAGLRFAKYELSDHIITSADECDGCSTHCAAYAVQAPCAKAHNGQCDACTTFLRLPRLFDRARMATWSCLRTKYPTDLTFDMMKTGSIGWELNTMHACACWAERTFHLYLQHVVRGDWQAARIEEITNELDGTTAILHMDHRMKQLERRLYESGVEHYAQSGNSLLGIMVVYKSGGAIQRTFVDLVVDDASQSAAQVESLVEAFIMSGALARICPEVTDIICLSDNGSAFASFDNVLWAHARNANGWTDPRSAAWPQASSSLNNSATTTTTTTTTGAIAEEPALTTLLQSNIGFTPPGKRYFLKRWIYFEAQRGKSRLDTHFAFIGNIVTRAVRAGQIVSSPNSLFKACAFEGGLANTLTLRVDVHAGAKVKFKPNVKNGKVGTRTTHDMQLPGQGDLTVKLYLQSGGEVFGTIDLGKHANDLQSVSTPRFTILAANMGPPPRETRTASASDGLEAGGAVAAATSAISVRGLEGARPHVVRAVNVLRDFCSGEETHRPSETLVVPTSALLASEQTVMKMDFDEEDEADEAPGTTAQNKRRRTTGSRAREMVNGKFNYARGWAAKLSRSRPKRSGEEEDAVKRMVRDGRKVASCNCEELIPLRV
jgi:hypothetical protein